MTRGDSGSAPAPSMRRQADPVPGASAGTGTDRFTATEDS